MHFTANNEPRALDVLGDLDPSIFNEVAINFLYYYVFYIHYIHKVTVLLLYL